MWIPEQDKIVLLENMLFLMLKIHIYINALISQVVPLFSVQS